MYQPVFTRLGLSSSVGNASEVSQAVSMQGANAAQADVVLYAQTATNVSFQLQVSNDLENWTNAGSAQTVSAVGFLLLTAITSISGASIRIKATLTGSGVAVLSAGVNTALL